MPPKKTTGGKKKPAGKGAGKGPAKGPKGGSRPATPASEVASQADSTVAGGGVADAAPEIPKEPITVAFSIGSEYATVTLLPTAPGQRGEIIANEDGERQIPAVVAIAGAEEIAGTAAKAQMVRNMAGTIRRFIPLLGLKFGDEKVQEHIQQSAVPVEKSEDDEPRWIVTQLVHSEAEGDEDEPEERVTKFTSVELTATLLRNLKQSAESYTGRPVDKCILSYPVNFNVAQQQALVNAAKLAELEVSSLVPGPIAAALAFEHMKRTVDNLGCNGLGLVADIGASSTTLSLVNLFAGLITPIADTQVPVGGIELDNVLFNHFVAEFKRKTKHDVTGNRKAEEKLMLACEVTRKVLSSNATANCHVESFYEGIDYVGVINRIRFESLSRKWREGLEEGIRAFLDAQNVDPDEIDHVLCIGGVAKTPFVSRLLESIFGHADVDTQVESDEAVSYGIAIHGLQPDVHHSGPNAHAEREVITPHLAHPVGILDAEGHFVTVVPRNSPLPLKHAVTIPVDAASLHIQIAEGRELVPLPEENEDKENEGSEDEREDESLPLYKGTVLGEIALAAEDSKKLEKLDLTFTIKANSSIHVSATAFEAKTHQKVHTTLDL